MIFLIFFAIGLSITVISVMLLNYADIIFYPQLMCVKMAPHSLEFQDLYQALVCGHKIETHKLKDSIRTLGLLHLFVISGTHLHFIGVFIEHFIKNKYINLFFLFFYCLVCGLQPPVLRAFSSQLVKLLNLNYKLGYRNTQCTFLAFIILTPNCLYFKQFPSLVLSTLASICVESFSKNIKGHDFLKQILIYICIGVIFLPLQTLHPTTLIITYFMTPLICYVLIPISTLSFFIPQLTFYIDKFWHLLFSGFSFLNLQLPDFQPLVIQINYALFLVLILISYFKIMRPTK